MTMGWTDCSFLLCIAEKCRSVWGGGAGGEKEEEEEDGWEEQWKELMGGFGAE